MQKLDIYQMVTNAIVERLESGVIPWRAPWKSANSMPRNLVTQKVYRGSNFWYLLSFGFERPLFLTFKQIVDLGGNIRRGSKSYLVTFWKLVEVVKNGKTEKVPYLRYYRVFHIDDVEGIDISKIPVSEAHDHDFDPIVCCEQLINEWSDCPVIELNKDKACYIPSLDKVQMPGARTFFKDQEFYSVLFHELVHSTGHRSRLDRHSRFQNHQFGSADYSQEELVAEMGAAYLSGITGIERETLDNSAAYIQGWLSKLKNDNKFFVMASAYAQHAVDYIIENQRSKFNRSEVFTENTDDVEAETATV